MLVKKKQILDAVWFEVSVSVRYGVKANDVIRDRRVKAKATSTTSWLFKSKDDADDFVEMLVEGGVPKDEVELDKVSDSQTFDKAFLRVPKRVIGNELYTAYDELKGLYWSLNNGHDLDMPTLDRLIAKLEKVKKSAVRFNSKDEIPAGFDSAAPARLYIEVLNSKTGKPMVYVKGRGDLLEAFIKLMKDDLKKKLDGVTSATGGYFLTFKDITLDDLFVKAEDAKQRVLKSLGDMGSFDSSTLHEIPKHTEAKYAKGDKVRFKGKTVEVQYIQGKNGEPIKAKDGSILYMVGSKSNSVAASERDLSFVDSAGLKAKRKVVVSDAAKVYRTPAGRLGVDVGNSGVEFSREDVEGLREVLSGGVSVYKNSVKVDPQIAIKKSNRGVSVTAEWLGQENAIDKFELTKEDCEQIFAASTKKQLVSEKEFMDATNVGSHGGVLVTVEDDKSLVLVSGEDRIRITSKKWAKFLSENIQKALKLM